MLIASRPDCVLGQTAVATDPTAQQRHRDWAEREIADREWSLTDLAERPGRHGAP